MPQQTSSSQASSLADDLGNGFYTYIVRCSDGTLYTGWTVNLQKRIRAHNDGKGAKYTRTRRPVELVYYECLTSKEEAMSREWHIKQLSRQEKQKLFTR